MEIIYDGSFPGFLTVIFETFTMFSKVEKISVTSQQESLFQKKLIKTDIHKSQRVYIWLKKSYPNFTTQVLPYAFSSGESDKDIVIGAIIHQLHHKGEEILDSAEETSVRMAQLRKRVCGELHRYKGLVRFQEIQGEGLYACIEPESDILVPLSGHFKERLPGEIFLIHDCKRGVGGYWNRKQLELIEVMEEVEKFSMEEEKIAGLWRTFTRSISIAERKNLSLQQSNMPKKYWKYLTEMQHSGFRI